MGMRKKIFNGLLIMLICAAASLFGGSAVETHAVMRDITYSFYMDITVNGTVGSAIEEQTCTISINGGTALVRPISAGTDISKWFMGSETPLPAGLKVTVAEDAAVGAKKLKVKFSGTVYGASKDEIKIVPQNIYFDDTESDWYAYANVNLGSSIAKFNITRNASTPSGYSGVGNGIYVKDQKSGTAGWILKGEKGAAITSNNEMQVYINGNFLKPLSAGADISYWFTGELYVYKEIFNASIASVLPDGVVARVKNAVSVGDNSFTIVFSGTPAKGSMDLIAFTIPAGMVSFSKGGATKGDYQEGCKVTNNSCKYAYDISTDNYDDLHTEFVKITYPEATLEAGKPVTEEDNLLITYELVGEVNRTPITFQGITLNHTTVRGMCYQNAGNQYPAGFWNDHITTMTGLQATVIAISQDQRTVTARITGTPKKQDSYPYVLRGRGFILNASYNTADHLITGYTSGDTTLTIVEPAPEITINKNVTIYKGEDDEKTTITNAHFTISLGDDTLAKAISKGEGLPLFYPETHKDYDRLSDNGVSIYADEDTPAGAHEIKVYVSVYEKGIRWTQKGYLNLAFPQDYITRTANYGTQKYYNIPFSRIYEDITKKEEVVRVNELSDLLITGTLNNELIEETYLHKWYDGENQYHEEWDTRVTGIKLNPIGTEKLYFTLTCFYGLNVEKSYEAGDSVLDFVKLNLYSDDKESPFYIDTWSSQFVKKDFKFYDIHTVDPIEAGRTETPRVFNLMIDLSEFYAMQASTKPVHLYIKYIDDSGIRPVYTNTFSDNNENFRFNIKLKGNGGSSDTDANYDTGIVYNKQDIIIYAKDASGNKAEGTYINLTTEKFTTELDYKCYSTDGGTKWKAATKKLTDKNIVSMLNKGMTLVIADKFDSKTKAPADDAVIYTFDEINARPAAPKLKVDYALYPDAIGVGAGQWGLTDSTGEGLAAADLALLDIGIGDSKGKAVNDAGYGSWPSSGGLNVAPLTGTKVSTNTFFVRVAPTADTPASKVVKVKVKGQQKAPNVKADYKNEVLKVKKDMTVYFGENASANAAELSESAKTYEDYAGKLYNVTTAEQAKAGVNIAAYITDTRNTILVWNAATAKKPMSKAQEIKLPARAAIEAATLTVSGGKFKLDKKYEIYDAEKNKWGGLPKITGSCELQIRLKATAKAGKESDTTYAASVPATLKITWGEYDTAKHKEGITAAEIIVGD